jgi:hypothetical protein
MLHTSSDAQVVMSVTAFDFLQSPQAIDGSPNKDFQEHYKEYNNNLRIQSPWFFVPAGNVPQGMHSNLS